MLLSFISGAGGLEAEVSENRTLVDDGGRGYRVLTEVIEHSFLNRTAISQRRGSHRRRNTPSKSPSGTRLAGGLFALLAAVAITLGWWFISYYTISLQNPIQIQLRWPAVISERAASEEAEIARADQHGHRLSAWQQYACTKFGSDCRVALAIQRAENPQGKCEVYHYNADGTLDWGYFQINTVHLKRPGLNLRDLLDCKANIDFAYQLFLESHSFAAWSTYNSGKYRQFMKSR